MRIEQLLAGKEIGKSDKKKSMYDALMSIMAMFKDKSDYWKTDVKGEGMDGGIGKEEMMKDVPEMPQHVSNGERAECYGDDEGKLSEGISKVAAGEMNLIKEQKIPKFD